MGPGTDPTAYSPDGQFIATCGGMGAVLWDIKSGEIEKILGEIGYHAVSVCFSPDGSQLLTGGEIYDGTARLWDIKSGEVVQTFSAGWPATEQVGFSPNGEQVLTVNLNGAALWDIDSGSRTQTFGLRYTVNDAAFSPDGARLVTGGSPDGTVIMWDAQTGSEIGVVDGHSSSVNRDFPFDVAFPAILP